MNTNQLSVRPARTSGQWVTLTFMRTTPNRVASYECRAIRCPEHMGGYWVSTRTGWVYVESPCDLLPTLSEWVLWSESEDGDDDDQPMFYLNMWMSDSNPQWLEWSTWAEETNALKAEVTCVEPWVETATPLVLF